MGLLRQRADRPRRRRGDGAVGPFPAHVSATNQLKPVRGRPGHTAATVPVPCLLDRQRRGPHDEPRHPGAAPDHLPPDRPGPVGARCRTGRAAPLPAAHRAGARRRPDHRPNRSAVTHAGRVARGRRRGGPGRDVVPDVVLRPPAARDVVLGDRTGSAHTGGRHGRVAIRSAAPGRSGVRGQQHRWAGGGSHRCRRGALAGPAVPSGHFVAGHYSAGLATAGLFVLAAVVTGLFIPN